MDKYNFGFEDWYDTLQMHLGEAGIPYGGVQEEQKARQDYEDGKCVFDIIDDIKAEFE